MKTGKYFEEFEIGEKGEGNSITITDAHLVVFGSITGDFNALHFNEEFARQSRFKGRVAHGLFLISLASAALGDPVQGTVIGNMGVSARFKVPAYIGDTITPEWEVTDKKLRKGDGIVTFKLICRNQRGEVVMEGEELLLIAGQNKPE